MHCSSPDHHISDSGRSCCLAETQNSCCENHFEPEKRGRLCSKQALRSVAWHHLLHGPFTKQLIDMACSPNIAYCRTALFLQKRAWRSISCRNRSKPSSSVSSLLARSNPLPSQQRIQLPGRQPVNQGKVLSEPQKHQPDLICDNILGCSMRTLLSHTAERGQLLRGTLISLMPRC